MRVGRLGSWTTPEHQSSVRHEYPPLADAARGRSGRQFRVGQPKELGDALDDAWEKSVVDDVIARR
jgi:hypothetical protein